MPRGKPFVPGVSGNPQGRKAGLVDRRLALTKAMGEKAEAIIHKVIDQALKGDLQAAELILKRIAPPLRAVDEPIQLSLPSGSPVGQADTILSTVAAGGLTPDQGAALMAMLASRERLAETEDLRRRIEALEKATI